MLGRCLALVGTRGIGMLEFLIALLIFSMGMMGLLSAQLAGKKAGYEAEPAFDCDCVGARHARAYTRKSRPDRGLSGYRCRRREPSLAAARCRLRYDCVLGDAIGGL